MVLIYIKTVLRTNANGKTAFLAVCGVIYLVIGALIFSAVERANEERMEKELSAQETEFRLVLVQSFLTGSGSPRRSDGNVTKTVTFIVCCKKKP